MRTKKKSITAIWAILLIVALAVPLVSAPAVLADTEGPNYPNSANVSTSSESPWNDVDWSTPGNVNADDGNNAQATDIDDGDYSYVLRATNFGFSIPNNATITGIMVEIECQSPANNNDPRIRDNLVQLTKDGTTRVGDNYADTGDDWRRSNMEIRQYGGLNDTWNASWSAADINDPSFGVHLAVKNHNSEHDRTAKVDFIRITVCYYVCETPADTGFKLPTAEHSPDEWTHGEKAYGSGYATESTDGDEQGYCDFGFTGLTGKDIIGIEVELEAKSCDSSGCDLEVSLSWDDGAHYTSERTCDLTGSDQVFTLGGICDLWGETTTEWTPDAFTDANFVAKVRYDDPGNQCQCECGDMVSLDWIKVKVYYCQTPEAPEECSLEVISDGCCNITVEWDFESADIIAGGNQTFTESNIPCGSNVTLTAVIPICCEFQNWTGNVTGAPNSTNPITITMEGNKTVTAHCTTLGPYTLTVISDGCCPIDVLWDSSSGNVSANFTGNFTIPCCNNVTLTAVNTTCCEFVEWTGNVPGGTNSSNPITIHMDGAKNITATCHWLSYNLTVTSDGCCPITVEWDSSSANVSANTSDSFTIPCCTNVTLTAVNTTCCEFVEWTSSVSNSSNPITVHMDANKDVTGHCTLICVPTCSIGDTIFHDKNGNGHPDPGEGLPGIEVELERQGSWVLVTSTFTDEHGKYEFKGLNCSATYRVNVVDSSLPPGFTLTAGKDPTDPIPLDPGGETYLDADFGYQSPFEPPPPVGGEAYPINKLAILAPWIALAAAIIVGASLVVLRRRRTVRLLRR